MGMFDTVIVKCNLEFPEELNKYYNSETGWEFQTKNLENVLDIYEVREDGTIWREKVEGDWVKDSENKNNILKGLGRFEVTKREWLPELLTQTITIYDYFYTEDDFDYIIEYELEFIRGKLNFYKLNKFNREDNSQRKAMTKEFKERSRAYEELKKTNKYIYIYKPMNAILNKLSKSIRWIGKGVANNLEKLAWFIDRGRV